MASSSLAAAARCRRKTGARCPSRRHDAADKKSEQDATCRRPRDQNGDRAADASRRDRSIQNHAQTERRSAHTSGMDAASAKRAGRARCESGHEGRGRPEQAWMLAPYEGPAEPWPEADAAGASPGPEGASGEAATRVRGRRGHEARADPHKGRMPDV